MFVPFQTVDKQFADRNDVIQWIILNQFGRRNLSPGTRSILALRLEPIFKEKAEIKAEESRKEFHGNQHEFGIPQISAPYHPPLETRQEIAKLAGVSHDTIDKVDES